MTIDLDRELLSVGVEHFDMLKSITRPPWYRRWYNKLIGRRGVYSAYNIKEFGALIIQEMDRIGIDVIIIVPNSETQIAVREVLDSIPLLANMRCDIVTQTFRFDWASSRQAQFLKSHEDLSTIVTRIDDVIEEY